MFGPDQLVGCEAVFVPCQLSTREEFPRLFCDQLLGAGKESGVQRVFLPYLDFQKAPEAEIVRVSGSSAAGMEQCAVVRAAGYVASKHQFASALKELKKSFQKVVVVLQLPVVAKYAPAHFGTTKCVRTIGITLPQIQPLEGAGTMGDFLKMLDTAMVGEKTAQMFKGLEDIGVVLSFGQ